MARNKKARKAKARPLSNHAKEAVSLINTLKETLDNLTKQQLNLASSDQLQRWVGLFAGAYLLDENSEVRKRILGENPVKINFSQEDFEDAHLNLYAFRFSRMETVTKLNEFYRTIPHELKALMDTIVNAVKAYRRKENTSDTLNEHTLFEWGATLTEIFGKCDPIVDASVEMGLKVQDFFDDLKDIYGEEWYQFANEQTKAIAADEEKRKIDYLNELEQAWINEVLPYWREHEKEFNDRLIKMAEEYEVEKAKLAEQVEQEQAEKIAAANEGSDENVIDVDEPVTKGEVTEVHHDDAE